MEDAIHIKDLTLQFADAPLFERLTFSVADTEKLTLIGPSGSGKSTLLRCIMGFVSAAAGAIYIQNEKLTARSVWHLRGKMAYVAQEPELGDGFVRDTLLRPFSYHNNRLLSYDETEALQLFDIFRLPRTLMKDEVTTLSGGEKQRIALVTALLLQRPILLLDEGASALDKATKRAVRDYLNARTDLTILSVSHDTHNFSFTGPVVDVTGVSREAAS